MSAAEVTSNLRHPVQIAGAPEPVMTLAEQMAHYRVPGVSIALIENGRVAWAEGYGVNIAEGSEPVTPETHFQAASISKPVAAACALRLVELGALELDEDVNTRLTSWQVPENDITRSAKVTVRRILSHSAGLTVHGFRGYAAGEAVPSTLQVLNGEAPANSKAVIVDIEPGTQERYSGGGYTVLQQLIEDVTGLPFEEAAQQYVLEPVGMTQSTYVQPLPESLELQAATAHDLGGNPITGRWHTYPEQAAAGLWTTPTDLARFALALQASLRGDESALLQAATVREMLTPQLGSFGLGLQVNPHEGKIWFSHSGWNEGYRCALLSSAFEGQGMAVMTNGDDGVSLYQELLAGASHVYNWNAAKPKVREQVTLDLTPYVGTYCFEDSPHLFTIEAEGTMLKAKLPDNWQGWQTLIPESATRFFLLEGGQDILFSLNAQGKVEALAHGDALAKKEAVT